MNKHEPDCWKVQMPEVGDGPCTCGLDDPPPVTVHTVASITPDSPCPHCHGTGRLTTPEPPAYKAVEPYVGDGTGRPYFRGGD